MELIKEIVKMPGLLKEVYGDLAKPGVEQVGKALETVLGLGNTLLWPVALVNEKSKIALEKNLEQYRKRLEHKTIDEISEVPPEVGVPISEKIAYVTNEQLSDMYIELLSKASVKSEAALAHPSFVNIINNISPDEAILLRELKKSPVLPFVEIRLPYGSEKAWVTINPMHSALNNVEEVSFKNNIVAYISNFEGLGLLQVRQDIYIAGQNIYEPLEHEAIKNISWLGDKQPHSDIAIKRGRIDVTPFGQLFLQACFAKTDG